MDQLFSCSPSPLYITLILLIFCRGISGSTFTLVNKCSYTVWPGILGNAKLDSTGFELNPGTSRSFQVPPTWSGRFWGRTGLYIRPHHRSRDLQNLDFYDVSLVDGYNLPMIVEPSGGTGNCLATGCIVDLNQRCPAELRVESGDGCKSACEAFGNPEYCCSGTYGTPATCKPSVYSEMFKAACPRSYSYAYDDATSTFTCMGADYTITFCPSVSSQKSARDSSPTTNAINGSVTGSSDVPTVGNNGSWLPNFVTGDSSRTVSSSSLLWTSFASAIYFILTSYPLFVAH
ncbi:hypothetical protein Pint_09364 [Pistacia integerrima]|uniref:Uncharacterized protein n=1 Tax=Pistacia integerrima TaxID=434235 RepID=A0ACC0XWA2_9ROSI|nr:hypothetical protein Pint_09364 [Pistacia integerrima]